MTHQRTTRNAREGLLAFGAMLGLAVGIACIAQPLAAQTLHILHTFTGGPDGGTPFDTLTLDRAGNLYGTASAGGNAGPACHAGCGVVFRMSQRGSGWIFTPLYSFPGDGSGAAPATPYSGVTIGSNGTLYGTTLFGGNGFGTVFNLQPPARATGNVLGGWTDTVLYRFQGGVDGAYPAYGTPIFDPAGNIYGTTSVGGAICDDGGYCGTMFKLTPAGGGWTKVSFAFPGGAGGGNPLSGVIRDASGNLYGTTDIGNYDPVVYGLIPSGSGWSEVPLHTFGFATSPRGGVIFDGSGGLFGTTVDGTVYQLTPSGGQWNYDLLAAFSGTSGSWSGVTRDASGNLYGTTCGDGAFQLGSIFKLTHTESGWVATDLHDFAGGIDGSCPVGGVVLDAVGNLYGTSSYGAGRGCGGSGCGVVWEFTP
jgi:uncharacterized repeat protein (TIGR03803 family)